MMDARVGEVARTTAILGFSLLRVCCAPGGEATGEPTNEATVLPSPSAAEAVVPKPPTTRFTSSDEGYTLYTLSFLPWSPAGEGFERLETLFETVVSTFEFPG